MNELSLELPSASKLTDIGFIINELFGPNFPNVLVIHQHIDQALIWVLTSLSVVYNNSLAAYIIDTPLVT